MLKENHETPRIFRESEWNWRLATTDLSGQVNQATYAKPLFLEKGDEATWRHFPLWGQRKLYLWPQEQRFELAQSPSGLRQLLERLPVCKLVAERSAHGAGERVHNRKWSLRTQWIYRELRRSNCPECGCKIRYS
jgi:hypothetical protein